MGNEPLAMGGTEGEAMPLGLIPVIDGPGNPVLPDDNGSDRYTERISYDKNSNITSIERYGMNNQRHYGLIDSLVITRNGNQLKTIEDYAQKHLTYTGASDFYDGCTYNNEYSYNANGALDHDLNRDIDMILYDDLGNTRQINYFDHEQIEYIYSADGTKLRAIYRPTASSALTDSTDYVGSLILKNGQPSMYMFDGGFVTFNSNGAIGSSRMHYYIRDYMGNNRMVVNSDGTIEQVTHYYPYGGVIGDISTNENLQKYKFEGPRSHQKEIDNLLARRRAFRRGVELDRTFGLDNYDIHARQYFAMMPSWDRIDPLAEDSPQFSPYSYCMGNPVNLGDYNGESTRVVKIDSTHYQVVGGDINDGDNNIYVCIDTGKEGEDRYENTWFSIGITPTMTSFYNSDSNQWKGKIDVNDNSGYNYIKKLESDEPSLLSYCIKAQTGELYDFKETNGEEGKSREDHYRGMPFGTTTDGTTVYSSARDIGNITIGYICGAKGVPWSVVRIMFDRYQGESEGISSQNAQRLGWSIGIKNFLHR